ncbi:MFS transporter, partial [Saccharopolyspora kobensis]
AGFAVLAQVGGPAGPAGVVAGLAIAYFGTGPADVLGTDLAVGGAPPGKAGAAASMSETTTELGVAVGPAGLGSLGALAYRGEMAGSVPAGIAPEAADRATDTMAGAVTAARQLPADLAGELLALARDAYTGGLIAVAAAAATTTAVLAVLAIALLRRRAN